jgi:micrococcal nuclease
VSRWLALTVSLVPVTALCCACARAPAPVGPDDGRAVVESVIDGDTIVVTVAGSHERVRLLGIDTPESVDPDRPVECFGPEAAATTASLLPEGTTVRLERDLEARDDYGRLLAYVFRLPDGLFVNAALVESGHAELLRIAPNVAYSDELRVAEATARHERRGLWGACSVASSR